MRYEVYRNKSSPEDVFQRINQTHKHIMCESKIRCEASQRNLDIVNANATDSTHVTPANNIDSAADSKAPLYFQETFREEVMGHYRREEKAKREIWPARQELPGTKGAGISQADIEFCEGLACGTENSKKIEW